MANMQNKSKLCYRNNQEPLCVILIYCFSVSRRNLSCCCRLVSTQA